MRMLFDWFKDRELNRAMMGFDRIEVTVRQYFGLPLFGAQRKGEPIRWRDDYDADELEATCTATKR